MLKPVAGSGMLSENKYSLSNLLWWIFLSPLFVTYSMSLKLSSSFHYDKQVFLEQRQTFPH